VRILVTASRDWSDILTIHAALGHEYAEWVLHRPQDIEFVVVQGGARGGDTIADQWAQEKSQIDPRIRSETHLADWDRYGNAAGHVRNQEMVDTGIDKALAFPLDKSPGTRGCMRIAKRAGVPVKQFQPKLW
jgi:hypothetical protein